MHPRAHAVFTFAFLLSTIAGCGLTLDYDPPDPVDGIDAGARDGGPPVDAGPPSDAAPGDAAPGDAGPADACTGAADGTACGEDATLPLICVAGRCQVSVCGDGVVDSRTGEACDDGNDRTADGCEPVSCVPSCVRDSDCDDGRICNGVEHCSAFSKCEAGTPPFSAACTGLDGVSGTCNDGFCVPLGCGNGMIELAEECDDGNAIAGDGCQPDCTLGCRSNTDCQDGDRCNGQEICTDAEGCVAGEPIVCLATDACHAGMCDPRDGCEVVLVDGDRDGHAPATLGACGTDCDDSDPARYPSAPERCNSLDDDCDGRVDEDVSEVACYPDADGDGFGDETVRALNACLCPAGTTTVRDDCFDAPNPVGAAVNPAQTSFFRLPYCRDGTSTDCSFDYDCDGSEDREFEAVHTHCSALAILRRCTGSGWQESVPACGVEGTWIECDGLLGPLGLLCTARTTTRVQTCR